MWAVVRVLEALASKLVAAVCFTSIPHGFFSADTVSRIRLYPSSLYDQDENYARRLRRGEQIPRGVHTLNNDIEFNSNIVLPEL